MAGGGGMAGSVDYPLYLRTMHGLWLTECNLILQAALAGSSPYAAAFAYNPEPDLDAALEAHDETLALIEAYDEGAWSDAMTLAESTIDATLLPDADITAEVDAMEAAQLPAFLRSVGRFAAGMDDAHSSLSAAFVLGKADMEADLTRSLNSFEATLRRERSTQRAGFILQGTGQILDVLNAQIESMKARARMRMELSQLTIGSQTARLEQEVAYDAADSTWDLQLFTQPGNLIASIAGGVATAEHVPRSQQAMSNALGMVSAVGPLLAAL